MAGAEDITLKVVTEAKSLQKQINKAGIPKESKNILSALLSETLNKLGKGADATVKDLSIASGNIKRIIGELVKAAAGAKGVSKELREAQKALEKATHQRAKLEKERSTIKRTKINEKGELRTSEANRLAAAQNVTNDRGELIKSYGALATAAKNGNAAALSAIETINRQFEIYKARLDELNNIAIPQADQEVKAAANKVSQVESNSPEQSASVQIQEFGNELQNLIEKMRQTQVESDSDSNAPDRDGGVNPADTLKEVGKSTQQTSNSLGKAFKQFSIYAIALRSIKKAAQEAVSTIKELDKSLTEQAMVTGKTRKQAYALLGSYQELAAQTGATTREVAGLATQFMRQGKSTQDALTLTKAAMDAAKVAGISAGDSVNYLTTALNGFQMSARDAMLVSDKFASIAANSATSYDEIATALSKVASQANLAGMSIDYTTALLAKGLETTREAPETMGTALKTVIARMREIGDYGETLGGDTDVNNVESQLAYVGIALRDANGELRSTEAVLDELGKKWDTLNSNQQAAVAKALAGTRQQSRLIAMMTDYERVVELQEISERSAGATLAQMETYLEGMDAALNRVSVAWEKIVTSLTDNQVIINLINGAANLLDWIGSLLENEVVTIGLIITVSSLALISLTKKWEMQKAINRAAIEERLEIIKKNKEDKISEIQKKKALISEKQDLLVQLQKKKAKAEAAAITARANGQEAQAKAFTTQALNAEKEILETNQEIEVAKAEQKVLESELNGLELEQVNSSIQLQQNAAGFASLLGNALSVLTPILSVLMTINTIQSAINAKKAASIALTNKETAAETKGLLPKVSGMFAKVVGAFSSGGIPGVIAGIAIATALAVALGVGIAASMGAFNGGSEADKTAEEVNKLSNEIYKLETKARAIETITKSYSELDNQIIKTKKDQEEMNELLDQAADKLSEEEKDVYNALITNKQRITYLTNLERTSKEDANNLRHQQLNKFNNLDAHDRRLLLDENTTNADYLTAQAAIFAINNNYLYEYINKLGEAKDGVEELTQSILEELSPAQALAFANSPDQIESLANALNNLSTQYKNLSDSTKTGTATDVLTSDDYSLTDKFNAYNEVLSVLDKELIETFREVYADIGTLKQFEELLDYFDKNNVSIDNINSLGSAIQKLGYDTDEATIKLRDLFESLEDGVSIEDAIRSTFDGISDDDYKKFINAYQSAMGTGILNMGQNIEGLKKTIDSFYEKAMKWSEMTDSEKTSFLADNAALFEGEDGKRLLTAIESGDYNFIQNALGDSKTLKAKVAQQIKDIDNEIAIENAKLEADRDYAYIAYLKEQKKLLQDSDNLYAASLDIRLEQEKKYLDEYKSYLEDQRDALKKSLDKRKEAYSDYFKSVNQEADDEEFENKESTLIANISKLVSSGSADSVNQQAQLEQELAQLEKERLEALRQRAQDAVMENIDKTIEDIDKKFDELLNSQSALLAAMTGELDNPTKFLSNLISNKVQQEGLTELGLESYIRDLQSTYGSVFGNDIFDNMSVEKQGDQLILNIAGTEVVLSDGDQQSVYTAIMAALQQVGLR